MIQGNRNLQFINGILRDPDIFHLTRRSAAGGVAIGLFIAFLPVPGHMLIAALLSILLRVNLPLAVLMVWVTNPLTMPPIFYMAYRLGATILDRPLRQVEFEISLSWFQGTFMEIWPSLFAGSLVFSVVTSVIGYITIRLIWRLSVVEKWERRKQKKSGKDPKSGV